MSLTFMVYRKAGIPQYVLLFLPLSKRLHSIFVLRLFNDCWSAPLSMAAIFAFQRRRWAIGSILFGLALSIKMNILLYTPALALILLLKTGLIPSLFYLFLTFLTVLIPSAPFLTSHPGPYIKNSFNLGRQFLYKWTVNWRFVREETFLSAPFAKGLLACHVTLLGVFGFGVWCRKQGGAGAVLRRALERPARPAALSGVSQDSWRTKYPILLRVVILAAIEYAWNIYPSTSLSSGILLASHIILIIGIFFGFAEGRNTSTVRWESDTKSDAEKSD
ncbi:dolichyl-P-Man:Man(5)GlcNAc(2)-PP-dolichol alpha-1,3-mannosyltransferase [Ceratobasidium sp. 392]|nr:dolichyl-P-Man:Man(5)GlcNAc(2)-PP-dolichol alpha-1,3-mannosyltransferase [Ceratobasidium sp. 392]